MQTLILTEMDARRSDPKKILRIARDPVAQRGERPIGALIVKIFKIHNCSDTTYPFLFR